MIYRISAFNRYTFKMPATGERRLTYARNAFRDCNARKTRAIGKRIIAYACYAIRDRYACKTSAIIESRIAYARNRQVIICRRDNEVCIFAGAYAGDGITLAVFIELIFKPFAGVCLRGKYKSVFARGGA